MLRLQKVGFAILIFGGLLAVDPWIAERFFIPKIAAIALGLLILWAAESPGVKARGALVNAGALFILCAAISTIFSRDPLVSLFGLYEQPFGGLIEFILIFGVYIAASSSSLRAAPWLVHAAMVLSILAIAQSLKIAPGDINGRAYGTMGNPVFFGAVLSGIAPVCAGEAANGAGKSYQKRAFVVLLLVILATCLTRSRSALLALSVGMGAPILFKRRRNLSAGLLVLLAGVLATFPLMGRSRGDVSRSNDSRL